MRTLQRLQHVRPPGPEQLERIERTEERTRRVRELFAWWRLVATCASLGLVAALAHWLVGLRRIEDGLVQAVVVRYEAPAEVRVAEVLCQIGEAVRRGQPLMRLEPRWPSEDRATLELELEQRRLRLALAEAGGELGDVQLSRRGELVDEAGREERLAREELGVARAEVTRLEREREALALELEQRSSERAATADALDARRERAQELAAGARVGRELAVYDEERGSRLADEGFATDRARVTTSLERQASEHEVAGLEAGARALALESNAAARMAELELDRAVSALAAQDAALDAARRRAQAAAARAELWARTLEQRTALAGDEPVDPAALRALELALRRAEVAAAEARLVAFDAQAGGLVVTAELDGVIEWLAASPGSVASPGDELVRYYVPDSLEVVVYLTPETAAVIHRGASCRLVASGSPTAVEGRVTHVGGGWVPCPGALPKRTEAYVDLRLPVIVRCALQDNRHLRPNTSVKVRFPNGGAEEPVEP